MKYCLLIITIILGLLNCSLRAQNYTVSEEKAVYIYTFAKFVTWEQEENIETFQIGVLGKDTHKKTLKIR